MKRIGLIHPFKSDRWLSVERYGECLLKSFAVSHSSAGDAIDCGREFQLESWTPDERLKQMWGDLLARRLLVLGELKKEKFDCIHILDQSYSHLVGAVPGAKNIVTCHDLEFWWKRNWKNHFIRHWLLKKMFKSDLIIVPSKTVKRAIEELSIEMNFALPKVRVVYNALMIEPRVNASGVFQETTSRIFAPTLLNVANTHWPRKNFPFLIELIAEIKREIAQVKLLQVGPEFLPEHRRRIGELGLEDNVLNLGLLSEEDLRSRYESSHLYLQPSLYEGFGLPLLESVAMGTPFLASDIEIFREITSDRSLVLPLEKKVWKDEIVALLRSPEKRQALLEKESVLLSKFSLKAFQEAYSEIYGQI